MARNRKKKGNDQKSWFIAPKRALSAALIISIITAFLLGCVQTRVRATGLEPNSKVMPAGEYRVLGEAEGESSSFNLLWVFPVTPRISYESAVNDAIARLGGDNLIDVRTWIERQIWFVGMVEILRVRGKVIVYGDSIPLQDNREMTEGGK
ncbi:MAG: hypothetical protein E4G96_09380 [Chrysiogenales bacterium]|nr:MAG: hypothetical protein E4G96_09380 [Chrysiogenales bacterium]